MPQPMPWLPYDPRVDDTVDGGASLDLIAKYATDLRPPTIEERELQAVTEWQQTFSGENPRYSRHRTPDGEQLRLAILTWIERDYHRLRRQAALGKLTPIEFETIHNATTAA